MPARRETSGDIASRSRSRKLTQKSLSLLTQLAEGLGGERRDCHATKRGVAALLVTLRGLGNSAIRHSGTSDRVLT